MFLFDIIDFMLVYKNYKISNYITKQAEIDNKKIEIIKITKGDDL
jgi:hypothetical protein